MKGLVLGILAVTGALAALPREVAGIVTDENGEGLPYATVRVKGKRIAALGDSTGCFRLTSKYLGPRDSLSVSYVGYETRNVCVADIGKTIADTTVTAMADTTATVLSDTVRLAPAVRELAEVTVKYGKRKKKAKGKKYNWALFNSFLADPVKGMCYGYEFHAKKDRKLMLTKVGFFYGEGERQMSRMKFRINVYDMSRVTKAPSSAFVNVLPSPIYFDFHLTEEGKGKFEYELPDPVLLPDDAMVEIEFLEDLGGEFFWFRSNLFGKSVWDRSLVEGEWDRIPFAAPFFVECEEFKVPE